MKVLVGYASRHGATEELARVLAEEIGRVATVDVLPVDRLADPAEPADLADYDAAVVGSAVYLGAWLRPATELLARCSAQLRRMPTWLFSCGPLAGKPAVVLDDAKLARLAELSGAREHRVFGGRLDRSALGLGEKAIVRMVGAPDGDFRDLGAARQWAGSIAAALGELASSRTLP